MNFAQWRGERKTMFASIPQVTRFKMAAPGWKVFKLKKRGALKTLVDDQIAGIVTQLELHHAVPVFTRKYVIFHSERSPSVYFFGTCTKSLNTFI